MTAGYKHKGGAGKGRPWGDDRSGRAAADAAQSRATTPDERAAMSVDDWADGLRERVAERRRAAEAAVPGDATTADGPPGGAARAQDRLSDGSQREPATMTGSDSAAAAVVLRAAADLIERDGWCQGSRRVGAARCLVGAVSETADRMFGGGPRACRAERAAYWAVESADPGVWEVGVVAWNDAEGRTAGEVVGVLRAAAEAS